MHAMQRKGEAPEVHELTVPDELLDWGRDSAVCRRWARPWAHEVVKLLQEAWKRPNQTLDADRTRVLLARLEALCFEAIEAGRGELLLGFDAWTAAALGLVFEFERDGRDPLVFGRGGTFRHRELEAMVAAGATVREAGELERASRMVRAVFPRGRIGAMMQAEDLGPGCAGCGSKDHAIMVSMQTGTEYCAPCWKSLVEEWPSIDELLGKKGKSKR